MEGNLGKQKVVDKTIRPLTTSLTSLTPATVTGGVAANQLGYIPIGNYKGNPAFWDLDLAVNQPNVLAEQLHITENIDGAGVDGMIAAAMVAAAPLGTIVAGTITVPAGEVWFINAVSCTVPADATGTNTYNWRCSLFPDALANVLGGTYHTAPQATPAVAVNDEFSAIAVVFGLGNKPVPLRLPAAATISIQSTITAIGVGVTGYNFFMQLWGWKGRPLVL